MIGHSLNFIAQELNKHICNTLKIHPSNQKVLLSSIIDPDGNMAVKESNVLLIKLINIEPDPIANGSQPTVHYPRGSDFVESAPLYLNLQFLLAAYFKPEQIKTGLDMLTVGIAFLQGKSLWNSQNTPELPEGLERLVFEMGTLDLHQLNHVWGAIGAKYMPSVIYKMKMLVIDDHVFQGLIPSISTIATSVEKSES
ncbi:MAG: DUF4255 domain-containing protein [Bacteroidota bacterium]